MMSLSSDVVVNSLLKSGQICVHVFWAAVSFRWQTVEESHSSASPQRQSRKFGNVIVSFQSFETWHSSIREMNSWAVMVSFDFSPKYSGILTISCLSVTFVLAKICCANGAAAFWAAWSMMTFWFCATRFVPDPPVIGLLDRLFSAILW